VEFSKVVSALLALTIISSCKEASSAEASKEDSRINWRKLSDNSFGWLAEDNKSVNAERCWKVGSRFQCLHLWRLYPPDMQVDLDKNVSISSFFRDSLQRANVYPEHGYSCSVSDNGAIEGLALVGGAQIQNAVSSRGLSSGTFWSPDYVRKFVAENSPSTPVVYFRCEAIRELLSSGNEAAFLTTAINARDLGLSTAP